MAGNSLLGFVGDSDRDGDTGIFKRNYFSIAGYGQWRKYGINVGGSTAFVEVCSLHSSSILVLHTTVCICYFRT